jgi:hypothetical protein
MALGNIVLCIFNEPALPGNESKDSWNYLGKVG